MKLMPPWLPPVVAALAVIGLVISIGKWEPRNPQADVYGVLGSGSTVDEELCEGYPWGDSGSDVERVLNVVVENEGVYIGEQCIPYAVFRSFMIKNAKRWRPHHAVIRGPIDGRFGHGVAVYETLLTLRIWPLFDAYAHGAGARFPAVELMCEGIPLEEWEQMEKEAATR